MLNLREYAKKPTRLADYLPWAALVAPGIILNKDGAFQRTARIRGPDLDSATEAELIGASYRLNNALRRLGSGWALFTEAQRFSANGYPTSSFPDPVSELIDAERRAQFEEQGAHYESAYFLSFLYLPQPDRSQGDRLLFSGSEATNSSKVLEPLVRFIDQTDRVFQLLNGFMPEADWLGDEETLKLVLHLHRIQASRVKQFATTVHPA